MKRKKSEVMQRLEQTFSDIGGFTWEEAQVWAGFCDAVGMDYLPFLKVMTNNICEVHTTRSQNNVPDCVNCSQLWVVPKGNRTRFFLVEP